MNGARCRSCGCITSADSSACPGQLGLGGTCRCHRVGATYESGPPSALPGLLSLAGIESARVTWVDADGRPVGAPVIVTRPAVIETWERKPDGGIVYDSIRVRPWATAPPGALPSGGPRLPPNEVAPQLLANVRERGDNWGDLANATADELRDALQLAARHLNARDGLIHQRAVESGPYMIGLWADKLDHVDPCDCDLDEENAGTNCMANSEWTYAVLTGGGSFAPEPVVKLPRQPPESEDDEVPDLAELEAEVARMRWFMSCRLSASCLAASRLAASPNETLLELYNRANPAYIDWFLRSDIPPPPPPMYRDQVLTHVDPEPNAG